MRRLVSIGLPLLLWGGVLGACSKQNGAVDRGGECSVADDCVPGLVCVEQKNGTRICTDDLSGVLGKPPGGGGHEDGSTAEAGEGGGMTDGPPPAETGGEDVQEPRDTGIDVGIDTGVGLDAGVG